MKSTTKKIKTTLAGVAALFAVFAPSFVSAQESSTYTVKEGDTLSEIAETHNTTVEKLAEKQPHRQHSFDLCWSRVGYRWSCSAVATPAPATYCGTSCSR